MRWSSFPRELRRLLHWQPKQQAPEAVAGDCEQGGRPYAYFENSAPRDLIPTLTMEYYLGTRSTATFAILLVGVFFITGFLKDQITDSVVALLDVWHSRWSIGR